MISIKYIIYFNIQDKFTIVKLNKVEFFNKKINKTIPLNKTLEA